MKIGTYYNGMHTADQVKVILSAMDIALERLPNKGDGVVAIAVPNRDGHQVHVAWDRMLSNAGARLYRVGHSHPSKPGIPFAWGGPFEDGAGEVWMVDRPDVHAIKEPKMTELTPRLVEFFWDCINDLRNDREHWANPDEEEDPELRAQRLEWWANFTDNIDEFRGVIAGVEWKRVAWKIGGSVEQPLNLDGIPEAVSQALQDDGVMEIRDLREDRPGWVSARLRHAVVSPLTVHMLGYYKGFIASEIRERNPHIEWIS